MEILETLPKAQSYNFYRNIVLKFMSAMTKGQLKISLPEGQTVTIGETDEMFAEIQIKNNVFFKKCIVHGDVGFGEAYVDGDWDSPDLTQVIKWMILNVDNSPAMSGSNKKVSFLQVFQVFNRTIHKANKNSKSGSKKNISYHYDLSNDFYKLWLDETMTYSSGIYSGKDLSLKEAQIQK